jgi:integrase
MIPSQPMDSLKILVDGAASPRVSLEVRSTKKFIEVRRGSALAKVYKRPDRWGKYRSYAITCRDSNGRLIREKRASLATAQKRAGDIATAVSNCTFDLTLEDRAELQLARKNIASTGKSLPEATSEYAQSLCKLPAGISLDQVVTFFVENRPKGFTALSMADLVAELLADKKGAVSVRWHRALEQALNRFAGYFTGPLHAVTAPDINAWLRKLDVGPRSRHNYRAAVEQLARWAQANGHLPKTWSELEDVADPGSNRGTTIKILTAEQLQKLLAARLSMEDPGGQKRRRNHKSMIPFLVLQAFAGVRHEEMTGEKGLLEWGHIHLDDKNPHIYIPRDVAKTAGDRVVPIPPNLAEWLAPYARRNGRVCDLENSSNALSRAKKRAGLPSGRNETRNALRKSFISYRLAIAGIAKTAEEAGNSPAVIKRDYKRPVPEAEAQRWFGISPQHAEVLQLRFF